MLVPYPGTELFDKRKEYGIHIRNVGDWDSYNLYQASDNITYDYLPLDEVKLVIRKIQASLTSLGYRNGHSSSEKENRIEDYYFSLPDCEDIHPATFT